MIENVKLWLNTAQVNSLVELLSNEPENDPTSFVDMVRIINREPNEIFGEHVTIEYQSVLALASILADSSFRAGQNDVLEIIHKERTSK